DPRPSRIAQLPPAPWMVTRVAQARPDRAYSWLVEPRAATPQMAALPLQRTHAGPDAHQAARPTPHGGSKVVRKVWILSLRRALRSVGGCEPPRPESLKQIGCQ